MTPGGALTEGYLVNDRFQLLRLLGRGGMGSVWVARHLSLNIDVAIKFIDAAKGAREDLRSRFAQEARTAARIQSPHVVSILDYGFDGDRPFIAMELLHGEPLGARLEREKRLPPGEMSTILAQAAKGLARAHSLGVVHRDLKPDNLFLSKDEEGQVHVKLLDFGIARDEAPVVSASHRTATGQLLGTPAYMSPEQAVGRPNIDLRSDLYSLAVVVYHCITGRLPFETEAVGELIVLLSTEHPPPPSSLVPGLDAGIDAWFRFAFQKEPSARFGSAKEMADTFALACRGSSAAFDRTMLAPDATAREVVPRFLTPVPVRAPPNLAATGAATPVARVPDTFNGQSATQTGGPPRVRGHGASPVLFGLVGIIVVVALGGVGLFATRGRPTAAASGGAAFVGAADGAVRVSPPVEPSVAPPAPPPVVSASAPPTASTAAPPARAPAPAVSHRPPSAKPPGVSPRPAPTNDYGL